MKVKTTLLFLLLATFLIVNTGHTRKIDSRFIGVWQIVKTKDPKTGQVVEPKYPMTYQFHGDGTLTTTDTSVRERLSWKWRSYKGILKIKSDTTPAFYKGYIRFKTKNKFVYRVRVNKTDHYIWTFERLID